MKIVQTKFIDPIIVDEHNNDLPKILKDRINLHNENVPAYFAYIHEYAWDAFLNHGLNVYKKSHHEAQGILLGKYYKDKFGEFIIATEYYEGEGESSHAYVGMSEACLAGISQKCKTDDNLMLIWLHTHPNFGAFYSGTDINCLKNNFYKNYQIGIVVDIIRKEHHGFKTINNEVKTCNDYFLFNNEKNAVFPPYNEFNKKKESVNRNEDINLNGDIKTTYNQLINELNNLKGRKIKKQLKPILNKYKNI